MRLYKGTDYIEVELKTPPSYKEIKTIERVHIPYSDKESITDMGKTREITLLINANTHTERDNILAFLDGMDKISEDGEVYYEAKYLGGNEITFFNTEWHAIEADLAISAEKYSLAEKIKAGGDILDNTGNHYATPTFEITGEATTAAITISDGVRTLTCVKTLLATDVLKISDYQALLNGEDISDTLSGNYPQIDKNQTDFTLTITGITASNVTVKYRDTWR